MVVETRSAPVVPAQADKLGARRLTAYRKEPTWRPGDPLTTDKVVTHGGTSSSEALGVTKASVRASTGKE